MNKAPAFEWDPNKTQTYSLDQDLPLPGPAESFNKVTGANFTMDAPSQTLTLKITPSARGQHGTTWGKGSGSVATAIEVKRGYFVYDAREAASITILSFGDDQSSVSGLETALTVTDNGQFIVIGAAGDPLEETGVAVEQNGALKITATQEGVIDINCININLPRGGGIGPDIRIEDQAKMSVLSSGVFSTRDGTVNISSVPDAGYSLSWVCTSLSATDAMDLESTFIAFSGTSTGLIRSPSLTLGDTRISAGDGATCELQFNSLTASEPSQFILGLGTAKMQFDAYTDGAYPFDFINDEPKKRYPARMFEFTSKGARNGGQFRVRVESVFQANAIVSNGFVAIDGDVVGLDRVKAPFVGGYAIVTQS
jgi:hypothetical protein